MTDEQLKSVTDRIREKYDGEMHFLSAEGVEVIVAPPDRATYKRFMDMLLDDKRRGAAFETLLRDSLLYPSMVDLKQQLEDLRKPALVTVFAEKVAEKGGSGATVEEKKL